MFTVTVGRSATSVKVRVEGQGCRFVLSQWSRSLFLGHGQLRIIFPQSILQCNLCRNTVLCKIIQFRKRSYDDYDHAFGVSNHF